ncbi:hypothetical protein D7030_07545 [Flavobacteriaceae bacterium AU392]|nr:hypothetical protein D1817_00875 [Flavobacteriaceae bacterium]RKM84976.1 hypothetical protein D7030_07545 [Flavobacteriaceae bacterium AU392]
MKNILTLFLIFCCNVSNTQDTYQFINDVLLKSGSIEKLGVHHKFMPILPKGYEDILHEKVFDDLWNPIKSIDKDFPNKAIFLKNINFKHLFAIADGELTGEQEQIDFSKLDNRFKKIENETAFLNEKKSNYLNANTILKISKPFFNCSKDWVILRTESYSKIVSSGQELSIFRKVDGEWILYHRLFLSIP